MLQRSSLDPPIVLPVTSSALEFDDFSFWDQENGFVEISDESWKALTIYLKKHYTVQEIQHSGPFLILECDKVPELHARPFTVAGCVAVWLSEEEPYPPELGLGDLSQSDEELQLPESILQDLKVYRLPEPETLLAVSKSFPSATHITFLNTRLIIELPESDKHDYHEAIDKLPGGLANSGITLGYHNGELEPRATMKRVKTPKPQTLEGHFDDTNYVQTQGFFSPGAMLSSNEGSVSAGILVEKDSQHRLTVPFHCWQHEFSAYPDKLGDPAHFQVTQGSPASGTKIGFVSSRIGTSDIGLCTLKPSILFSNQFMDITTEAQTLLPSREISMNDEFMIDGFVTGRQKLKSLGRRVRIAGERDFHTPGAKADTTLPPAGPHISLIQNIHATSTPIINSAPYIREGIRGSALIRSSKSGTGNVVARGGIAGFMQCSDLLRPQALGAGKNLLCFVEALDEMIANGWEVSRPPEKRKAEEE